MFAIQEVRCVDGCGGDTLPIVIGLAIAALSAILSGLAVRDARQSRKSADGSLKIAQDQHAVFLAQQSARVDFDVALSLAYPSQERLLALRVASGTQVVRVRYTIRNIGTRAAEPVRFNVLYQADSTNARWTDEDEGTTTAPLGSMSSDEDLLVAGEPVATLLAYQDFPRLNPNEPLAGFFQVSVPLAEGWSRIEVPFSFRAWSDPMPEGIVNRRDDLTVILLREFA